MTYAEKYWKVINWLIFTVDVFSQVHTYFCMKLLMRLLFHVLSMLRFIRSMGIILSKKHIDLHTRRRRQACLIQIQWTCNCLFCLPTMKTSPLCAVIVVYHWDPTLNLHMTMSIIHIIRPMLKLCIIKYVILHQKGSPHFLCLKKCKMNAKFFSSHSYISHSHPHHYNETVSRPSNANHMEPNRDITCWLLIYVSTI